MKPINGSPLPALSPQGGERGGSWKDLPGLCARLAPLNQPAAPLTPSLSPSEGERVPEGRVRGSSDAF